MLMFESVFTAINNTKRQRKFNITQYGENVYLLAYRDIIRNLVGYVCGKFFTIKMGCTSGFTKIMEISNAY